MGRGKREPEEDDALAEIRLALQPLGGHVEAACRTTFDIIRPLESYVAISAGSFAGFSLGLVATQATAYALRISCRTPVIAPMFGLLGVGASSAVAGQIGKRIRAKYAHGTPLLAQAPWEGWDAQEALQDAVVGIAVFKVMGGSFMKTLPSDVAKPGAFARHSLPAKGAEYASATQKAELTRWMRRDGCHTCGSRQGEVIGDHMPPNKHVHGGANDAPIVTASSNPAIRGVRKLLGFPNTIEQRYFPQCRPCSNLQSSAVRTNRRRLVLHNGGFQKEYVAGALAGLRHLDGRAGERIATAMGSDDWRTTRRQVMGAIGAGARSIGLDVIPEPKKKHRGFFPWDSER